MTFRDKVYTLREENAQSVTKHFISFRDNQGTFHDVEVSELLYIEFRKLERKNRNLQQSDERHKEFSVLTDETLGRRARFTPKSVDEIIIEKERSESLKRAIVELPEIQRRRFILHFEYELTYREIAKREGCSSTAIQDSLRRAREKIRKKMEV